MFAFVITIIITSCTAVRVSVSESDDSLGSEWWGGHWRSVSNTTLSDYSRPCSRRRLET